MTFLLVHGLGLSSNIWSRLIPFLDGEVLAVDLPGHGESDSTDFSWHGLWKTLANAVCLKEWAEITLVMHSFSACLLPEIISAGVRPAKIILIEGILHPADALWTNELTFLDDAQFDGWLIRFRSVSEMALRSQLFSRNNRHDIQLWSDAFKRVNGEALRVMAFNLRNRLGTDDIPIAIESLNGFIVYLRGGRSRLSLVGRTFLESNSIVVSEIQDSGHFPMIDNSHAVIEFLNSHCARHKMSSVSNAGNSNANNGFGLRQAY